MSNLFSNQTAESVTIFVLLLIILLCFARYVLFSNNVENKGVQKIIGGLSVFIVALLSHDIFVQMVSLFIGGLIIASEEFMQNLAIIVRSASGDIGKNLSATKATEKEIERKREGEVQKVKTTQQTISSKARIVRHDTITVENLENIEKEVANYFKKKYGENFQGGVKITFPSGQEIIADGVIRSNIGSITKILEIKHIYDLATAFIPLEETVKLFNFKQNIALIVCFVVDKKPSDQEIIEIYNSSKEFRQTEIGIFEMKNGKLKPLLEP